MSIYKKFVTIQDKINGSTSGHVLIELMDNYVKQQSLVQIPKTNNIERSTRIAYVRSDNKFRSGGFLLEKHDNYLLFKGFNGAVFSLQIDDIKLLFIGTTPTQKKEIKEKKLLAKKILGSLVEYKKPKEIKKYSVNLFDNIIYSTPDESKYKRFLESPKYNNAKKNGYIMDGKVYKSPMIISRHDNHSQEY